MKINVTAYQLTETGLSITYTIGGTTKYLLADPFQSSLLMCDTGYLQSRENLKGSLVVKKMDWWYRFEELHQHYSVSKLWAERFAERHEENLLFKQVLTDMLYLPAQLN